MDSTAERLRRYRRTCVLQSKEQQTSRYRPVAVNLSTRRHRSRRALGSTISLPTLSLRAARADGPAFRSQNAHYGAVHQWLRDRQIMSLIVNYPHESLYQRRRIVNRRAAGRLTAYSPRRRLELALNYLPVKALRIWRSTTAAALRRAGLADQMAGKAIPM